MFRKCLCLIGFFKDVPSGQLGWGDSGLGVRAPEGCVTLACLLPSSCSAGSFSHLSALKRRGSKDLTASYSLFPLISLPSAPKANNPAKKKGEAQAPPDLGGFSLREPGFSGTLLPIQPQWRAGIDATTVGTGVCSVSL